MHAYSLINYTDPTDVSRTRRTRLRKISAAFASAHGLTLDKTKRKNSGAFRVRKVDPASQFLRAVDDGSIAPGSTLLAESLEGILPARPKDIIQRFTDIVTKGITIVTFPDQVAHDSATLASNPERLFLSLIAMIQAQDATQIRRQIAIQSRKIAASSMAHDHNLKPMDLGVSAYRGKGTARDTPSIQSQGSAK